MIKKYKNRKLYDTQTSKYLNLKQIYEILLLKNSIEVVDHNDKDITHSIVLESLSKYSLDFAQTKEIIDFYSKIKYNSFNNEEILMRF